MRSGSVRVLRLSRECFSLVWFQLKIIMWILGINLCSSLRHYQLLQSTSANFWIIHFSVYSRRQVRDLCDEYPGHLGEAVPREGTGRGGGGTWRDSKEDSGGNRGEDSDETANLSHSGACWSLELLLLFMFLILILCQALLHLTDSLVRLQGCF